MAVKFSLNHREQKPPQHGQHSSRTVHLSSSYMYPNRAYQERMATQVAPHRHATLSAKTSHKSGGLAILFTLLAACIWIIALPWLLATSSGEISRLLKLTNFTLNDRSLQALAAAREPRLKQTEAGVTNIMIVGIDTREKDKNGLRNTDTLILASYNHKLKHLSMISFPRDILAQYPDTTNFGKINSVYQVGEVRKSGQGLEYLKRAVEQITDQTVHYYVMINLRGFEQIIDAVGGVTVNVERAFTDNAYPTDNYGYQVVSFKAGEQKMNGKKALQYARSRHGSNGEASDYARARRQQKVIQALSDKIKSSETLQNPVKIYEIFKAVTANITTSPLTPEDVQAGINLAPEYKNVATFNVVLDPLAGNSSLMQEGGAGYQFGFHVIPQEGIGKWTRVQKYIKAVITQPEIVKAEPTIYVYNTGDPAFQTTFNKIRSTYFYLPIYYGGSSTATKGKQLFNLKSTKNQAALQLLSTNLKLEYKASTTGATVPKPANVDAVILLGK